MGVPEGIPMVDVLDVKKAANAKLTKLLTGLNTQLQRVNTTMGGMEKSSGTASPR